MLELTTLVTSIVGLIGLFEKILNTYDWLRKVLSEKAKEELENHINYLQVVKQVVGPYGNSNCSEASITGALKLLQGALNDSCSNAKKWQNIRKDPDDIIKELNSSKTTIAQYLQLFSTALQICRDQAAQQAAQHTDGVAKLNINLIDCTINLIAQPYNGNRSLVGTWSEKVHQPYNGNRLMESEKVHRPDQEGNGNHTEPQTRMKVKERNDGKPQRSKEFEKQEKEREVTEYRAWLSENITKWTDSWTTYKTDSERATNSKLDLAEKERLFRKHVDELREQYLRDYRQLLKEVITPDLASKYLTSWSDAKNRMLQRQRFLNLPEKERETEWGKHAEKILKQRQIEKEIEVTEYKAWLSKNITKWTDSWTTYKTDSERATNSKLDLAEKERLFRKHVDELREQYRRDYRQLLKEVITPDLASKYLTSWSDAKSRMLQRQRFLNLPERERETEWRSHAEQIQKKKAQN